MESARRISPLVEEIQPDAVLLDLRGLTGLFGPPESIANAILNEVGLPANIAIAANPDAAIFAARGIHGITVIPDGKEAEVLAPLPVNLLPGSPECASILAAWGIRTFGQFAALPELGVTGRLGVEGTALQHLARGKGRRYLRPHEDPIRFEETVELEHPVDLLEPLLFLVARALKNLCTPLAACSLAADEVLLKLTLEGADPHCVHLRVPLPISDPSTLLKLIQLELAAKPPAGPVLKLYLNLNPAKPRNQQHGLFLPKSPEPAKLEVTLSRLYHLLAPEQVGTPELLETYGPDVFRMARFSAILNKPTDRQTKSQTLVLRRIRPPLYAHVRLRSRQPIYIETASIRGDIVACAGPWRTSGDWFSAEPWDCAEWDVALRDSTLYRIFEDLRTKRWFIAASYD